MVAQHGAVEELGVGAIGAVPGMAAVSPRQLEGEGGEEVVERPSDDDVVVETNVDGDEDHGIAHSCGGGTARSRGGCPWPRPRATHISWRASSNHGMTQPLCLSFSAASPIHPGNPPALRPSALSCPRAPRLPHQAGQECQVLVAPREQPECKYWSGQRYWSVSTPGPSPLGRSNSEIR